MYFITETYFGNGKNIRIMYETHSRKMMHVFHIPLEMIEFEMQLLSFVFVVKSLIVNYK